MKLLFLLGFASLLLIGLCEETTTEEGPIVNTPELPSPTSVEPDQSTTEEGPIENTPEAPSPTSVEPDVPTSTAAVATGFVAVATDEEEADSDVINLINSIVEQKPIPDQPILGEVTTEAPAVTPLELDPDTTTELGDEKDDFVKFNKKFKRALKKANLKKAAKNFKLHNKKLKKMKAKKRNFKIGMSPYMHLDDNQIKKLFIPKAKLKKASKLPKIPTKNAKKGKKAKNSEKLRAKRAAAALPTSFDWRTKNVVSPVRDQGDCGSCWTFSATAVVEINYARKYATKVDLSEMQLTCVYNESTVCEGGLPDDALEYILESGGQTTEVLFPYSDAQKSTCKSYARKAKIGSVASVLPFGMYKVKQSLIANGPIAFGMLVNDDFMNYESGVFDTPCTAADEENGHAMSIVGYGQAGTVPYWIVRNEWGSDWGEGGYIRIKAGVDLCNIESMMMTQAKIA